MFGKVAKKLLKQNDADVVLTMLFLKCTGFENCKPIIAYIKIQNLMIKIFNF